MRNGNFFLPVLAEISSCVLTVPMRNGNAMLTLAYSSQVQFLPYLWGMETLPCVCELHVDNVLTVPMRNGNTKNFACRSFLSRSYRTYEEWKLASMAPSISSIESSYRTYEEWKPAHDHKLLLYLAGSYRTYEEWKPTITLINNKSNTGFLPYLWGMETFTSASVCSSASRFLPYLWGMETFHSLQRRYVRKVRVLTVPMRNGNLYVGKRLFKCVKVLTVPMRNGNFS